MTEQAESAWGRPGTGGAPRTVELTRIYHLSAAHRLESPHLRPEDNLRLFGACSRVHGHNYYVEVTARGVPDPVTGMAVDLAALDEAARWLIDAIDHRQLETVPELRGVITTGENLARAFWEQLAPRLPALARVAVRETAKNRFEYRGEGGAPA